jgi:hypothetical protein
VEKAGYYEIAGIKQPAVFLPPRIFSLDQKEAPIDNRLGKPGDDPVIQARAASDGTG